MIVRNLIKTVVFAIAGAFCLAACHPPPLPSLRGEVSGSVANDTLSVQYDLEVSATPTFGADSVVLLIGSILPDSQTSEIDTVFHGYLLHSRDSSFLLAQDSQHYQSSSLPWSINGALKHALDGHSLVNEYKIKLCGPDKYWIEDYCFTDRGELDHTRDEKFGYLFSLGIGSLRTTLPDQRFQDLGTDVSVVYEIGATLNYRFLTGYLSLFGNGISDSLDSAGSRVKESKLYTDYISLRFVGHLFGRDNLYPKPVVGIGVSRLNFTYNQTKYDIEEGVLLAGVVVESKRDRFMYTYNSLDGGIHRVDALIGFSSQQLSKFGTMYSYHFGQNMNTFQVRFYFEMGDASDKLRRKTKRSFLLNSLSSGLGAPFYWIYKLLQP